MAKIKNVFAKEIKDSRGNPTLEVSVETDSTAGGGIFTAGVPSGASTGKNEAVELRDEDGKGVQKAIDNVNNIIAKALKGKNPENQKEIDDLMIKLDGTENKSQLGANAIVGVSVAVCRAGAGSKKMHLYEHIAELNLDSRFRGNDKKEIASHSLAMTTKMPLAMFNLIEGGAHTDDKEDTNTQEFMVVPQKKNFSENLILCNKIFNNLKDILENNRQKGELKMGFEGGFAPEIAKTEQALYLLKNAIEMSSPAGQAKIAIDVAASEFYKGGKYILDGQEFSRFGLLDFYKDLVEKFDIISIEDPFAEEDWNGFEDIKRLLCDKTIIVGDDLTTTNIKKIKEAHSKDACNGIILKLNQIGTVSETIEACSLAKSFGWKTIVSHRSGETMDDFIADLAVGLSTDFVKFGSPAKEERMVKYKRLLEIEKELGGK